LDAGDGALELGGAKVVARELRQADPAANGAGTVVDVDRHVVDVLAIGDQHAALAGRDDLVELKAERAGVAEGAEPLPAESRTRRLADVLDHRQPVGARDPGECLHVCGGAAHVHRQESLRSPGDLRGDVARVERQRVVDLGEHGDRSGREHCVGRGIPRVGRDDDLVVRPDPRADQPTDQGRGARVDGERVLGAEMLRELALERRDLVRTFADSVVAEYVLATEDTRDRRDLLLADLHPARKHRRLRTGAGGLSAVPGEP